MADAQKPPASRDRRRIERRIVDPIVDHPRLTLSIIGAITLVLALFIPGLTFDTSIEGWFLDDDPDLIAYQEFLEDFVADEVIVVGLFAVDQNSDGIFTAENLERVDALTRRIEQEAPYVHRVRSLTTVDTYDLKTIDGDETIVIEPIVPSPPPDDAETIDELRERALDDTFVAGSLVSDDARATALLVEIDKEAERIDQKSELIVAIDELADEIGDGDLEHEIAGGPVLDKGFLDYSQHDLIILGPLSVLLILIATWAVFRRASAALVPMGVVVIAGGWLFGFMGVAGFHIDIMSSGLIVLVLAVGVADTIHVLADYDLQLTAGASRDEAVRHAVADLMVPCMFTSMTTAAGLLSLTISDLGPVRAFGGLAALGVTFAFVLSMTLVPALLKLVTPPDDAYVERQKSGPMTKVLAWLGHPPPQRRAVILVLAAVVLGVTIYAITTLHVGSNPMNYFRPGDPLRESTVRIDEALGGTTTVEFLADVPDKGLLEPERLKRLDAFERWVADLPNVAQVDSPLDALKELHRLWTTGEPEAARIPDDPRKVRALFRQIEGTDDFEAMVQDNYSTARFTARVELSGAAELAHQMPRIEAELEKNYQDDGVHIRATGMVKLMANMERYLLRSQIESLLLAFVVVTFMIFVLLRSFRLALFSLIPNVLPIIAGLGTMALAGIALDPGTVMIGSIALGLVVDDTVHYLVRLRRTSRRPDSTLEQDVEDSMHQTGRPIIVTSLVLSFSFLALGLGSSFAPNLYFGVISALVIVLAVVADLVVLPAALLTIRPSLGGSSADDDTESPQP